jgi:N-acyl-D-aspartate/D-glutamate deacylase
MNENDIRKFMTTDFIAACSDGSDGHPRKYGTYTKLLHEYVYSATPVLTVEQMVRRSSSDAAAIARIKDRGTIATGKFADVIVFDPRTVTDKATYEKPTELSVGMKYVIVNGVVAVDDGR